MASFIGSSVVEDGLIFHYDMDNTEKSWKGKPTTNLYIGAETSAGSEDGFGGGSYLDTSLITKNPFGAGNIIARKSNSGVATWSVRATLTEGVTYTYSVWCKTIVDTSINLRRNEPSVYLVENKVVTVTPGVWTRVSFTFTVNSGKSGSQVVGINVGNANAGQANNGIYLTRAQLEQSSFATPYVNDSRSNVQAIIDIAGGNTVTANSLTYNSDGTFNFNTTESLNIGPSSLYFPTGDIAHNLSVEMVLYPTANYKIVFGQFIDLNRLYIGIYSDNTIRFGFGSQQWGFVYTGGSLIAVNLNEYCHICLSIINGTARLYVNGIESVYFTDTAVTLPSKLNFGVYYENGNINSSLLSNCKIPVAKLYNKGLSAQEVKQNFESVRGRYGI